MCSRFLPTIVLGMLLSAGATRAAQDIDTVVNTTSRNPSTVADQIADPAERAAFLRLYQHRDPADMLKAAKSFLQDFPRSAFLAQAYEIAADSSFDQHDYPAGLDFAKKSLTYLPENPQLLGHYKTGGLGTHRNYYDGGRYVQRRSEYRPLTRL